MAPPLSNPENWKIKGTRLVRPQSFPVKPAAPGEDKAVATFHRISTKVDKARTAVELQSDDPEVLLKSIT
ncbi:hypothetical protein W97_02872 [Coniosporium apollinis CBS 100218]|uniref:Uncharacterized protein n=1 Tax=Coniosporium apollinis (strain CBS 100218) TaxID=1168221 RepID=R7YPB8_CONA1|nr:uncharacterized protein W97_02872 [Coniosporium apollinis CBS 100218]EON63644.1 hypothetical protein W97_02872 [Coniosporium apollinis CBS 100218]